jgi:hypothetical protein
VLERAAVPIINVFFGEEYFPISGDFEVEKILSTGEEIESL